MARSPLTARTPRAHFSATSPARAASFRKASGTYALNGANTYTGATIVSSGILQAGSTTAFGVNSAVNVASAGDLQFAGKSRQHRLARRQRHGGRCQAPPAPLLTLGGDNTSPTFSGTIQNGAGAGILSVTKIGTGTQTFAGTSTFTGQLSVNAGAVDIAGAFAAPIAAGATAGANGIVNIQTGAVVNANSTGLSLAGGISSGSAGAFYQSGGSVTFNAQLVLGDSGSGSSYGFYDLTGGTLASVGTTNTRFRIGGAAGGNGTGIFYQSGGTAVTLDSTAKWISLKSVRTRGAHPSRARRASAISRAAHSPQAWPITSVGTRSTPRVPSVVRKPSRALRRSLSTALPISATLRLTSASSISMAASMPPSRSPRAPMAKAM